MTITYTPKAIYVGALAGAVATLYTASTSGGAIVKEIVLCNTSSLTRTVTLYVVPSGGSSDATNEFLAQQVIDPNGTLVLALSTVMAIGDTIRGFADLANVVSLRVSGMELAV